MAKILYEILPNDTDGNITVKPITDVNSYSGDAIPITNTTIVYL